MIVVWRVHEQGAEGRRQGQRHHHRNQDGAGGGEGELLEQPAHHAAHEQQRDKRGDQGKTDRHHGETDFPRALECRFDTAVAGFQVAVDVLHHDDGVIHHEAHGNHDGHQRQVVQAEAEQVHQGEAGHQ